MPRTLDPRALPGDRPLTDRPTGERVPGPPDPAALAAARLLAIALTVLLVSVVVIDRTRGALDPGTATPVATVSAGSLRLRDDDGGTSMFELNDLLPGRPRTNCITVTYTGTAFGGMVELRAVGGGALAPDVEVEVESGTGGGFGRCAGFHRDADTFHGTLAELVAAHGPDGRPLAAFAIDRAGSSRTFRFTVALRDVPGIEGRGASIAFEWSVRAR